MEGLGVLAVVVSTLTSIAAALLVLWAQPYLDKLSRPTLFGGAIAVGLIAVMLPALPTIVLPWVATWPWREVIRDILIPVSASVLIAIRVFAEPTNRDYVASVNRLGRELTFLAMTMGGLIPVIVVTVLPRTMPSPGTAAIGSALMLLYVVLFFGTILLGRVQHQSPAIALISLWIGCAAFIVSVIQSLKMVQRLAE